MFLYQKFKESLNSPHIGEYITFGIVVFFTLHNQKTELLRISDVSVDEEKVNIISELCTKEQLDPIHIYDVIEDYT